MAGSLTVTLDVRVSGPLADGTAARDLQHATDQAAEDLAKIGRDWIRIDAESMDRSGRGGTGRASGGVKLSGSNGSYRVYGGIHQGVYSWPWLEGISKRNRSTRFHGYHTFRKTAKRLDEVAEDVLEEYVAQAVAQMGGG